MTNDLLCLPVELISDIVSQWIELRDVSFLDIACNKEWRAKLVNFVFKSKYCVLHCVSRVQNWNLFLNWVSLREISLSELFITKDTDLRICIKQIEKFGRSVATVTFNELDFTEQYTAELIRSICLHCKSIVSLFCCKCDITEIILDLLRSCSLLQAFQLTVCFAKISPDWCSINTDKPLAANLNTLVWDCACDDDSIEPLVAMIFPGLTSTNTQRLNVCCTTDTLVYQTLQLLETCGQNIRSLGFSFSSALYDGHLALIVASCPNIVHLDFNHCLKLTDNSIVIIARYLPQIRTINMTDCWFTDDGLCTLAEHCKDTLEALFVGGCMNITGVGLNAVLRQCHKLHTLAFSVNRDRISCLDARLLCNIYTLQLRVPKYTQYAKYAKVLLQSCDRLQKLYITGTIKELDAFQLPSLPYLPAFHSMYLNVSGGADQVDPVAYAGCPKRVPIPTALQKQRPNLRISFAAGENWPSYLMKLPI